MLYNKARPKSNSLNDFLRKALHSNPKNTTHRVQT